MKFGLSRHYLENPLRKWPGILHAHVSSACSKLSRLWSEFVDCYNFGTILTSWNGWNYGILVMLCGFSSLWWPFYWNCSYLGFLGIIWRTCGSKCRGGERSHISHILVRLLPSFALIVVVLYKWSCAYCFYCQLIWMLNIFYTKYFVVSYFIHLLCVYLWLKYLNTIYILVQVP